MEGFTPGPVEAGQVAVVERRLTVWKVIRKQKSKFGISVVDEMDSPFALPAAGCIAGR